MICTGGSSAVKGVILRCGCLNTLGLDKLRTNPQGKHGSLTTFCQTAGVSRLPYAAFAHLASNCWNPLRAAWFSLVSDWRHAGPSMCAVAQLWRDADYVRDLQRPAMHVDIQPVSSLSYSGHSTGIVMYSGDRVNMPSSALHTCSSREVSSFTTQRSHVDGTVWVRDTCKCGHNIELCFLWNMCWGSHCTERFLTR